MSLRIEIVANQELDASLAAEVLALCSRAYEDDFSAYFELLRGGVHMLGWRRDELVAHVAWVERELRVEGMGPLASAYIEAVATAPEHQRRGYATALLAETPPLLHEFDLAALSPSDPGFYERLGWELWQGPLSYTDPSGAEVPTPEELLMVHRLPNTPRMLDMRAKLSTDWRAIEVW